MFRHSALCEFRTSQYGDPAQHDKFVRLAIRNARLAAGTHPIARQLQRLTHRDYPDPEARDRARSTWLPHAFTCQALADLEPCAATPAPPTYTTLIAAFAANWFSSGHPVPNDYLAADAQPADLSWRDYQSVRGPGDGRRPPLTEPFQAPYGDGQWDDGLNDPDADWRLLPREFAAAKTQPTRAGTPTLTRPVRTTGTDTRLRGVDAALSAPKRTIQALMPALAELTQPPAPPKRTIPVLIPAYAEVTQP